MDPITVSKQSGDKVFSFVFSFDPTTTVDGTLYNLNFTFYRDDIYNADDSSTYFNWTGTSDFTGSVYFNVPVTPPPPPAPPATPTTATTTKTVPAPQKTANASTTAETDETDPETEDENTCSGSFYLYTNSYAKQYVFFDMNYGTPENKERFSGNMVAFPTSD